MRAAYLLAAVLGSLRPIGILFCLGWRANDVSDIDSKRGVHQETNVVRNKQQELRVDCDSYAVS